MCAYWHNNIVSREDPLAVEGDQLPGQKPVFAVLQKTKKLLKIVKSQENKMLKRKHFQKNKLYKWLSCFKNKKIKKKF